jgi:hypothetical protein
MRVGARGVDHFAVAIDNEKLEIAPLVSEYERYAVVHKTLAIAFRVPREMDPRR